MINNIMFIIGCSMMGYLIPEAITAFTKVHFYTATNVVNDCSRSNCCVFYVVNDLNLG